MNATPRSAMPPAWLMLLLVVMAFAFQGTRGIWEPDEGRYTSTGINMLESGDWLVPTIDGEHAHLTKPPVVYWALASSFGVFGLNEWAARLPAALAYVGTGLLLFGIGRRLVPAKPWLPALAWGLGLAPLLGANIVSTDALLMFFETAAMFAFVEAWWRGEGLARGWVRIMWLCWGLAFMTKGPPGLLPLFAVIAMLAFHERRSLRALFDPMGLLLFAVVAFTWFGVLIAQEPDRLGYFLGYEVYDRVFTAKHQRNAQWYGAFEVYLPVLLVGALPWTVMALIAAGGPRKAWSAFRKRLGSRDRDWLLLAWWFFLPLVIFCLARSRLQLYVLPLFAPLALMTARALAGWDWLTMRRLASTAAVTALLLLGAKGALAYWKSDRDARAMAVEIHQLIDPHDVDEIAFVGMRPFYGLNLYLDTPVE
ncbi:MAG TPA: glycosyltransferase family 39 protein, partial [Steroidobacteraceae bacterium]|nr:glycosyltransferase family 39 protein [Steroidobacteraceae bacterium]